MPSKSAKTRKHTRKRVHKELSARRTEASRERRLENKAKREAIHDIDPDVKIKIIDQDTYIDGDKVEVVNGKIVPSALPEGAIKTECDFEDAVVEYQEVMDEEECIKALDFALTSKEGDKYPTNKEPDCKLPMDKQKAILCKRCGGDKLLQMVYCQPCQDIINEEPDCKLPAEKKSWKQVLKEWSNG